MTKNMDIDNLTKETNEKIEEYWEKTLEEARTDCMQGKDVNLPLARIKRLMKVEEEVKMVANDVPILFSKITEKFVEELTLRAWYQTKHNRRRIMQKNDISIAVKTSDVFDFLIYVVPKAEYVNEKTKYDEEGRIVYDCTTEKENNK